MTNEPGYVADKAALNLELRNDVENLLYREAALLDEGRLYEWLELFTDSCTYWVPISPERPPERNSSIIYDNRRRLEERVHHLMELSFAAQSPPSRTIHCLTNVLVEAQDGEDVLVACNQIIYELRRGDFRQTGLGEQREFAGRCRYRLTRTGERLLIAEKQLVLLNRDIALSNMTFPL